MNQLLGGANAVGRRVHYVEAGRREPVGGTTTQYEIVGVVTDLGTNSMSGLDRPIIYHSLRTSAGATVLIRMRGNDPLQVHHALRPDRGTRSHAAVTDVTFSEMKRQRMIGLRLMLLGFTLVVVTALLLSAAGIYAMMSFTVSQRRKEIGIRAAMGADSRQLLSSIFTKAALRLASGVVVGIVLALLIDRASDGEMLGSIGLGLLPIMALVMVLVGLFATLGPARRGLRIQPTEALRANSALVLPKRASGLQSTLAITQGSRIAASTPMTSLDGHTQISREFLAQCGAHRRVGRRPTAVGLRRVDLPLSMRRHPALVSRATCWRLI